LRGKVLIAVPVHEVLSDGLTNAGYELIIREQITRPEALQLITDCEGVITSTRLLLNRELLDAAPQLKWIGRMGSGMEVIDVPYAETKGIKCYSSPEGNRNAVAEHALGMLLGVTNKINSSAAEVINGQWRREENRGIELEGRTIGLIGFGNTGRAFAKKLQGFDMRILAYDKYDTKNVPGYVEMCPDMQPIFEQAEIVSLHIPLNEETRNYVNANFLLKMTQAFILINTSRGEVVDTSVLQTGLESKKIKGACLDVWPEEPLEKMSRAQKMILQHVVKMPQVIVTPHIAGYTFEALFKMSNVLLAKISESIR
jgi:D-3-phosphoglycerate dehydrogenase / 2-oxoglutarate reductase